MGTTFPAGFPAIDDTSLGKPVIGFGAAGPVHAHAGDLPARQQRHAVRDRVQSVRPHAGVRAVPRRQRLPHERAVGPRLPGRPVRPAPPTTTTPALEHRAHQRRQRARPAPLRATPCSTSPARGRSTSSAHSLGVTLAREWMRQDDAYRTVRRFVAIDGPNHGIINCSPNPANYYQLPSPGGFTPRSEVCEELGSPDTPFLQPPEHGRRHAGPTRVPGDPQRRHQLRLLPAAGRHRSRRCRPRIRSATRPTSRAAPRCAAPRARSRRARAPSIRSSAPTHLGILNSPQTWQATFEFLTSRPRRHGDRERD